MCDIVYCLKLANDLQHCASHTLYQVQVALLAKDDLHALARLQVKLRVRGRYF